MANAFTTQTLVDGPKHAVVLLTGILDTANEAKTLKVDVSALSGAPTRVVVDEIEYAVSGNLKVLLYWDATADVVFAALSGQGELCAHEFGGFTNNAGAGVTGDIELATAGYATGTETYTIVLHMRKH